MALVVTAFAKSYDFFMYYNTLILTPMLLMGGVFFPLERMPVAIQWGAQLLPLKHAVDLVRPLVIGAAPVQPLWSLLMLVGYTAVCLVAAIILIRRRLTG
jgi:lipooligosaccharide transport system permease protein